MGEAAKIRIFSVDDHPLLQEGLATVIRSQPDMSLVAEAANGREALQQFRAHTPDVTLMDLRLPDMSGIDAMTPFVRSSRRPGHNAEILCITEETVKVHIKHIMGKLGASDRTQAVAIAVRRGIIQL